MSEVAAKLGVGLLAVPLSQEARRARSAERTAMLGMVLFLASWAMLFAALFFAYGLLRARALAWPPADLPRVPRGLPTLATALLALSAVALELGRRGLRATRTAAAFRGALAAALLGAGFLALQIVVWRGLWDAGLRLDTGPYASVFFGLTVFHGAHVALGVVALLFVAARAYTGAYTPLRHVSLRLWSLYWHMVGIVWLIMYVLLVLF